MVLELPGKDTDQSPAAPSPKYKQDHEKIHRTKQLRVIHRTKQLRVIHRTKQLRVRSKYKQDHEKIRTQEAYSPHQAAPSPKNSIARFESYQEKIRNLRPARLSRQRLRVSNTSIARSDLSSRISSTVHLRPTKGCRGPVARPTCRRGAFRGAGSRRARRPPSPQYKHSPQRLRARCAPHMSSRTSPTSWFPCGTRRQGLNKGGGGRFCRRSRGGGRSSGSCAATWPGRCKPMRQGSS